MSPTSSASSGSSGRFDQGLERCQQAEAAGLDQVERAFVVALGAAIGIRNVGSGEHPGPFSEPARCEAPEFGEVAAIHRQHMTEAGDVGGHDRKNFVVVHEERLGFNTTIPGQTLEELIRADMTYIEKPKGGAVFSVGSITYCGSLPHNKFDNDVSRLTFNVVNRFGELGLKWPF